MERLKQALSRTIFARRFFWGMLAIVLVGRAIGGAMEWPWFVYLCAVAALAYAMPGVFQMVKEYWWKDLPASGTETRKPQP